MPSKCCPDIKASAQRVGSVRIGRDKGLWKCTRCRNGIVKWVPTKSKSKRKVRKAVNAIRAGQRMKRGGHRKWGKVGDCCARTQFVDPKTREKISMSLAPSMIMKRHPESWLASKISGEPVYKIVRTMDQLEQAYSKYPSHKVFYGLRRDKYGEFHTAGSA